VNDTTPVGTDISNKRLKNVVYTPPQYRDVRDGYRKLSNPALFKGVVTYFLRR
jgi:hypothetical protein